MTSGCTEMLATPASTKAGIRESGRITCRCASTGSSVARAREAATAGPTVRFGTKWLSMTSKCTSSAPPASARRTSSARFAKSAARIEGAPATLSSNSLKNPKSYLPNGSPQTVPEVAILQHGARSDPRPPHALVAIKLVFCAPGRVPPPKYIISLNQVSGIINSVSCKERSATYVKKSPHCRDTLGRR